MNAGTSYSEQIKTEALRLGFSDCGISRAEFIPEEAERLKDWLEKGYHAGLSYMENHFEKRTDPCLLVEGSKSIVSVILNYFPSDHQADLQAPVLAKYAYGKDYHKLIRNKLNLLLSFTKTLIPGCEGRVFTDSAPVMEHVWASRSGLGWIGKNSLLLTSKYGSFVFIGEMILTVELDYDTPVNELCGSCRNCITSCPTGAIIADKVIDAGKCISYHTIENRTMTMPENLKEGFRNRVFGCDICQDVCPWNRKAVPHTLEELTPPPKLMQLSMDEWHAMDKETFDELFEGSAVKRAKFEGLRRNLDFLRPDQSPDLP